jgi:hypothetical protein
VRILGSVPLEEAKVEQPEDWPFRGLPGYKYGSEAGVWKVRAYSFSTHTHI